MQYYVQEIARNYLKNLTNDSNGLNVHKDFLHGVDPQEFTNGFIALKKCMRDMYTDMMDNPANFGVPLIPITEQNPMNTDYTKSHDGFKRFPHMLLAIGVTGVLHQDLSITLDGGAFLDAAKRLKLTKIPEILTRLIDYGFEISGLSKSISAGDELRVAYPDSRALTAALKSMSEAQSIIGKGDLRRNNCYFYMMMPDILSAEKVKEPKLGVESMYHALNDNNRGLVKILDECAAGNTKINVKTLDFMRNRWSCIYTGKKSKQVLMTLKSEQDELFIKLNLEHIGDYMDAVKELPSYFQNKIRENGWNCGSCNGSCSGGFSFTMDDVAYNKCRCGSFVFDNMPIDDARHLKRLLELELRREK